MQVKLISLLREIKDLDTYDSYGIVEIQQPYGKLESICHIKGSDDLKVYLITNMKSIAYPIYYSNDIATKDTIKYYLEQISSGLDESVLSSVQAKAEEFLGNPSTNIKEMKIGGLGLLNTYIRLKLLYQNNMVFKVESNSGKGTKITIGGKA